MLVAFVLLLALPRFANWREHRALESAASHVELGRSCERTGLVRDGDVFRMFGKAPFITVTYMCSGLTHDEVRDAVGAALQHGGFRRTHEWHDVNYGQKGRLEVSDWSGHSSGVSARISGQDVTLEFDQYY